MTVKVITKQNTRVHIFLKLFRKTTRNGKNLKNLCSTESPVDQNAKNSHLSRGCIKPQYHTSFKIEITETSHEKLPKTVVIPQTPMSPNTNGIKAGVNVNLNEI